jgi:HK97 family phage major capsid protein
VPALNQTGTKGLQGGVTVHWIGEGDTKPETDADLRLITLEPNEVAAHVVVTDKLLRNWPVASTVIGGLLAEAVSATEDDAFFQGTGGGRPLGVLGHSSSIEITRHTSSHVEYVDLANMLGRACYNLGSFEWVVSQTVLPELLTLTDGSGRLIFTQGGNAIDGFALQLLGNPVHVYGGSPVLGTKGDVCLIAPGGYLIKDGSPMRVEASPHLYFTSNKTVIRCSWNVDGRPWLSDPLTLKDGVTTVSPFVVLS